MVQDYKGRFRAAQGYRDRAEGEGPAVTRMFSGGKATDLQ
jgi:hypothetical protein